MIITKEQYEEALDIVCAYRKQQNAIEFPKVIADEVIPFTDKGFVVYYKCVQVSARKESSDAFIYFPKSGYRFSNLFSMQEIGFFRNGKFTWPQDNGNKTFFYYVISQIATMKSVTDNSLRNIRDNFCNQFPGQREQWTSKIGINDYGKDNFGFNVGAGVPYNYISLQLIKEPFSA